MLGHPSMGAAMSSCALSSDGPTIRWQRNLAEQAAPSASVACVRSTTHRHGHDRKSRGHTPFARFAITSTPPATVDIESSMYALAAGAAVRTKDLAKSLWPCEVWRLQWKVRVRAPLHPSAADTGPRLSACRNPPAWPNAHAARPRTRRLAALQGPSARSCAAHIYV
ncbi:hypothetical protein FA09DRAFT_193058 [Tilletiopsis washingtonensis]|uniref:Uncharacterized protein n=1 Tax=Tilletiopsis washingtonensis TaxID=58919 RepID=A0A316ZJS4_9BASI|nr:hypothetical protein FA09DRAFT_193058 [Tilletiopsis washingtonensis]PWO00606.1 hypothetical protein FA09DRAFT_193058 [Tilletiopsis washingtonensis]